MGEKYSIRQDGEFWAETSQHTPITGHSNSIIQIVGDNNNAGHSGKCLFINTYKGIESEDVLSDLELLYPRVALRYHQRSSLKDLADFLDSEHSVAVRLITGAGGRGKTRLAWELCRHAQQELDWEAGFIPHMNLRMFYERNNPARYNWPRNTLLVIDHAGHLGEERLTSFLEELAQSETDGGKKLRVLLLERRASKDDGWWKAVARPADRGYPKKMLYPADPIELFEIAKEQDKLRILRDTFNAAVQLRQREDQERERDLEPVARPDEKALRAMLRKVPWSGQPLYLKGAALLLARGDETIENLADSGQTALADHLAEIESRRLKKLIKLTYGDKEALEPELVLHLAACATLTRGLSEGAFLDLAEKEKNYSAGKGTAKDLFNILKVGDKDKAAVPPVLPDAIGEAFILKYLMRGDAASLNCYQLKPDNVLAVLVRCAQREDESAIKAASWLRHIFTAIKEDAAKVEAFYPHLPLSAKFLDNLIMVAARQRVVLCSGESPEEQFRKASRLTDLSLRLAAMSEHEQAKAETEKAMAILEKLAGDNPTAYGPEFAKALNTVSVWHSYRGEYPEALSAVDRALEQFERLKHQAGSAAALGNRASFRTELGDYAEARAEARAEAENAVAKFKELAGDNPDEYTHELAKAHNNLGKIYADQGLDGQALKEAGESVKIYRKLVEAGAEAGVETGPGGYIPDMAMALTNLGCHMTCLGRYKEARVTLENAVRIRRGLARHAPRTHNADLAASLANLGKALFLSGSHADALAATERAVEVYTERARSNPMVYEPRLAASLINLSHILSMQGHHDEACRAGKFAANLYREFAAKNAGLYSPEYLIALENLSMVLLRAGDAEDAEKELAAAREIRGRFVSGGAKNYEAVHPEKNPGGRLVDFGGHTDGLRNILETLALHLKAGGP